MDYELKSGIDSFSYYYVLTPKQKSKILETLKKLPEFRMELSSYKEDTYSYLSDALAENGIKIWVSRISGKPWGLLLVIHPLLVLGSKDRSKLYQPQKKSEYQKIVKKVDKLLKSIKVPCSIDKMKLYRVDVTANLTFNEGTVVDEYMRILKKSCLLPHYRLNFFRNKEHKVKDCKTANEHSHKQYCKSSAFFAYDKTAQLEMINAFPDTLVSKRVLRLEAQLRRRGMSKWLEKNGIDDSNWRILKKLGGCSEKILQWYLKRLQPATGAYVRYQDAVDIIKGVKHLKTRVRMLYLLRKASDSEILTAALAKLNEKYGLSGNQCRHILKKFRNLGISPITLKNSSKFSELPPLLTLT